MLNINYYYFLLGLYNTNQKTIKKIKYYLMLAIDILLPVVMTKILHSKLYLLEKFLITMPLQHSTDESLLHKGAPNIAVSPHICLRRYTALRVGTVMSIILYHIKGLY